MTSHENSRILSDGTDHELNLSAQEYEEFEVLVQSFLRNMNYTTSGQAALNLVYSMINAGFVCLPFAAIHMGFPFFGGIILFMTIISGYTSCILVEMADDKSVRTFEELGEKAFGTKGYLAVCFMEILYSFILMCISLNVWGAVAPDLLDNIIGHNLDSYSILHALFTRRTNVIIIGCVLVLPGCFAKTMSRLSSFTRLTVLALIAAVVSVIICYLIDLSDGNNDDKGTGYMLNLKNHSWIGVMIISLCFSFQQKLFFVYNCLRRRNVERWTKSVTGAHIIIPIMYLCFGIFGALNFESMTDDDRSQIEYNYYAQFTSVRGSKIVYDISRGIVAISLLCTFPVDCLVTVSTWKRFWRRFEVYRHTEKWNGQDQDQSIRASSIGDIPPSTNAFGNFTFERSKLYIPVSTDDEGSRFNSMAQGAKECDETKSCCFEMTDVLHRLTSASYSPESSSRSFGGQDDIQKAVSRTSTGNLTSESEPERKVSGGGSKAMLSSFPIPSSLSSKKIANRKVSFVEESDTKDCNEKNSLIERDMRHENIEANYEQEVSMDAFPTPRGTEDTSHSQSYSTTAQVQEDDSMFSKENFTYYSCVIFIWLFALLLTIEERTIYVVGGFGSFMAAIFAFILPSMFYFRLGVVADYQSIPIFGFLPNHLYMFIVQICGILLVIGNLIEFAYFILYES